ncbi:MAG: glutamate--tRNA ligase [Candidatus Nanoarchaeia archaeon]|nr:glutamate--tRNA ligase [Candidatus Nanoarchaeia archaeon]MDD5239497.1 glutamate--tRNA ligase [Candidatus Nanoarchaeia archaeon]
MEDIVLKWALKNAIDHNGKAVEGAVISKVIGEHPEARKDMKKLALTIKEKVRQVNAMDIAEQITALEKIEPKLLEKKKVEQSLPLLPKAKKGKVVMMFPPEPSKYPTIGHAKACILNNHYARENQGKFFIRFEDTNANKVKEVYYAMFLEDFEWLGIQWDDVDYISAHIEELYDKAEELIDAGNAYMCNCPADKVKEMRNKKEPCLCRDNPPEENLGLWNQMLENEFKQGEYALRAKIKMNHKNAVMRDPAIMRTVIGTHPRVGDEFTVWPTYDFATAMMDGIEGITHRVRGKEFELRAELQNWLQKKLKVKPPVIVEFARFNLEGVPASGRVIREGIASGQFIGWDDPRLPTLIALRKRGFQPQAIWNFVMHSGLSKTESVIQWDVLEAENRKVIEPVANRYFMVNDEVEMTVRGIPDKYSAQIRLHPDNEKAGFKSYEFEKEEHFLVNKSDIIGRKPEETIRLMELGDVKLHIVSGQEVIAQFVSRERGKDSKIVHWVKPDGAIDVEVMMPDAEIKYGIAEEAARKLKVGDIIQFVRFGFCRLDEKQDEILRFRFTHM